VWRRELSAAESFYGARRRFQQRTGTGEGLSLPEREVRERKIVGGERGMADESWVDLTREWSPTRPPAGGPLGELPDYLAMLREAQGETSCRWPQPLNSSARSSILLDRTVVIASTNRPSLGIRQHL
jgi:hypothetical protein